MLSGPEALNGLIFESNSATPVGLILIGSMAVILYSFTVGTYEVAILSGENRGKMTI